MIWHQKNYQMEVSHNRYGTLSQQYWTISKVSVITGCLLQFVEMRDIGFHPTCKFIASLDVLQLAKCKIHAFSCLEPGHMSSCLGKYPKTNTINTK